MAWILLCTALQMCEATPQMCYIRRPVGHNIGEAWDFMTKGEERKNATIRFFRKCGISIAVYGSEDHEINIKGLTDREQGYTVGNWHQNSELVREVKPADEIMEEDLEDVDDNILEPTFT